MVEVLQPAAECSVGLTLDDEMKIRDAPHDIDRSTAGHSRGERALRDRRLGDLRHEGVRLLAAEATVGRLEGPRRRREVGGNGVARHVSVRTG